MNRGIAKLSDLLPVGLLADMEQAVHASEQKKPKASEDKPPHKQPPKVVGDPTRTPVNRTAASMFFKSNWLTAPMPPEQSKVQTIESLKAEIQTLLLKIERLKIENEALRKRASKTKTKIVEVVKEVPVQAEPQPDTKSALLERLKNI